jgi:hypothetical protein
MQPSGGTSIERHPTCRRFSAHGIEGEPVSTICCGLLVTPADRRSGEVAIKQRPRASVPNNGDVAIVGGLRDDLFDRVNDPRLGICRGLPASNAGLRLGKKRINRCLELLLSEVARRGSGVLAEAINHAVSVQSKLVGKELCRVSRFALAAGEDLAHAACPRRSRHRSHACSPARIEWPIGNRDARVNRDIRVGDEEHRWH